MYPFTFEELQIEKKNNNKKISSYLPCLGIWKITILVKNKADPRIIFKWVSIFSYLYYNYYRNEGNVFAFHYFFFFTFLCIKLRCIKFTSFVCWDVSRENLLYGIHRPKNDQIRLKLAHTIMQVTRAPAASIRHSCKSKFLTAT